MSLNFNEILKNKRKPSLTYHKGEFIKYRLFNSIKINEEYSLSIQASPFHACDKKDELYEPNEYNTFEIAILKRITFQDILLDENVIDFKKLDLLKEFPRYDELLKCKIVEHSIENVSKDLVEDLYKYLIK